MWRVTWVIDVDASSHEEAARKARAAQVRPGTIATVFTVQAPGVGEPVVVDLAEVNAPPGC